MTMKKTTKKQRLFFALAPQQPADSVTALHQLTCQIDQAVPIDNLHITLAFLGMVTPAQTEAIVQAIDNHPPLALSRPRSARWAIGGAAR